MNRMKPLFSFWLLGITILLSSCLESSEEIGVASDGVLQGKADGSSDERAAEIEKVKKFYEDNWEDGLDKIKRKNLCIPLQQIFDYWDGKDQYTVKAYLIELEGQIPAYVIQYFDDDDDTFRMADIWDDWGNHIASGYRFGDQPFYWDNNTLWQEKIKHNYLNKPSERIKITREQLPEAAKQKYDSWQAEDGTQTNALRLIADGKTANIVERLQENNHSINADFYDEIGNHVAVLYAIHDENIWQNDNHWDDKYIFIEMAKNKYLKNAGTDQNLKIDKKELPETAQEKYSEGESKGQSVKAYRVQLDFLIYNNPVVYVVESSSANVLTINIYDFLGENISSGKGTQTSDLIWDESFYYNPFTDHPY